MEKQNGLIRGLITRYFAAIIVVILAFASSHAYAAAVKPQSVIARLKQLPIVKQQRYYIYTTSVANGYTIYVDSTKECHGIHYCNIGSLRATQADFPQIFYDRNNKEITKPVKLANKLKAYYTPAHPMADYWPTMLQWRDGSILYTLSWRLDQTTEQQAIVAIENALY